MKTPLHIPSPWVVRFAPLVRRDGTVLDLACGNGRHLRHFAQLGHPVVGVDIDVRGLADLEGREGVEILRADLEGGSWPFGSRRFAAVIVTNYLHRPLLPALIDAVEPGGLLLYETFAAGNERFGRPSSPAYLLKSGELLDAAAGRLQVLAFEQGEVSSPKAAVVQRLAAVNAAEPRPLPAG